MNWSLLFFIFSLVAALIGFSGIGGGADAAARVFFFLFLVLFVVSIFTRSVRRPI